MLKTLDAGATGNSMTKITYYDFSSFYYSGFFLNGFLANARPYGYRLGVSHRLPQELRALPNGRAWPQNKGEEKINLLRYEGPAGSGLFCIDASNLNGEYPVDGYSGYAESLLEICDTYFKVNYNAEVIAANLAFAHYADKIKPLPLAWPLATPQKWRFLPRPQLREGELWRQSKARERVRLLRHAQDEALFRRLRTSPRDIDVFFVNIYRQPREGTNETRLAILEELHRQPGLNLVAGFVDPRGDLPEAYAPFRLPFMPYETYLSTLARARIAIYVRGSFGCLSTKFGELMALGKAIVGETLLNNRANMLAYDLFEQQFAYDDPQEMVARIMYLLDHPEEVARLERANTSTYEEHFTPRALVAGLLDQIPGFSAAVQARSSSDTG